MSSFELPEIINTENGDIRRVGFEVEYAGVDLEDSTKILQQIIGGEPVSDDPFRYTIDNDDLGQFIIEIDAALLQDGKYKNYLAALGLDTSELSFDDKLDDILKDIASNVVPCEVVTPPLPMNDMYIIEKIVSRLRDEKAKGTSDSILYAFGLHINPELVSPDPDYLLSHIRAFALLYDWICEESAVDLIRKMTPYIDPYPDDYLQLILTEDYKVNIQSLINDYMDLIGSRNHALDMLPAFASINEQSVISKAKEPDLIKPRPAFHYRLANSLIDKEGWCVATEWSYWIKIEWLANNNQLLKKLCLDYLSHKDHSIYPSKSDWVDHINNIIG